MSITIVSISNPIFDDGTIKKWNNEHPEADSYSDISDVPLEDQSGLFTEDNGSILYLDKILAGDIRNFNKKTKRDILIITPKKTNAKFEKDGIEYKDLTVSDKDIPEIISKKVGISKKVVELVAKKTSNPNAIYVLCRQLSFNKTRTSHYNFLYNPYKEDSLPWDMFNCIIDGYVQDAVIEADNLIRNGSNPQDLMFQIIGYFKKVIASGDDLGNILANSNIRWFNNSYKKINDLEGLNNDLVYYYDIILNNKKDSYNTLLAFVASLSSRFKSR